MLTIIFLLPFLLLGIVFACIIGDYLIAEGREWFDTYVRTRRP